MLSRVLGVPKLMDGLGGAHDMDVESICLIDDKKLLDEQSQNR